jgi:hypothetical protein
MATAPPGGPGPSGRANRWAAGMWCTAGGSSTVAITRSRPPWSVCSGNVSVNKECIDQGAAGERVSDK